MTKEEFRNIMEKYGEAWETLDTDKLLTLFTEDATYQVKPTEEPWKGHEGIRKYWETIVAEKERDISFSLGSLYVEGNIGIAEWKTTFIRNDNNHKQDLFGVIFVEVQKGKIIKLWEYWHKREYE